MRFGLRDLERDFEKTENDMKALQSVGQIIGEVLKQLDEERCESKTGSPSNHSEAKNARLIEVNPHILFH